MTGFENMKDHIPITGMSVTAYRIPTDQPESDGTIEWDSTTLVLVSLVAGDKTGIGYTYAHASCGSVINDIFRHWVVGRNALDIPAITTQLMRQIRNLGTTGIGMMSVSAVDNALWDLKAKLLDVPVATLLGRFRDEMLIYGSGGFTSYSNERLQQQMGDWVNDGIRYLKMKIGREPDKDVTRVRLAREAIGDKAHLFVDANGAYTVALAIRKTMEFLEHNVSWFEEPVSSDNLDGLKYIRDHIAPVMVAAGEYGYNAPYFCSMLGAGAVDVLQADATRCGGITGFLVAAKLCEAFQVPLSSHCAPSIHLHAAISTPCFFIAEYFYDHVRIEHMLFDGVPQQKDGMLKPDLTRPGFGWEFRYSDAEKFKI